MKKSIILFITLITVFSVSIDAQTTKEVEHCHDSYETVELNGRTWIKTNIKVPHDGFEAMKSCCSELTPMKAGRSPKSPWWMSNFDYANKDTNPNPWFRIPYVSSFNDDPNDKHGAIFNYYAVEKCNICPSGFRLPTEQEFMEMANAVGGRNLMSRTGEDWGAIGRIDGYGSVVRGRFGEYWTSTPTDEEYKVRAFVLNSNGTFHVSSEDKRTGCYVRCIKEEENESAELNKKKFEMLAHSIYGGAEKDVWFLGVNQAEANQAAASNGQIRVRIVKRHPDGSIKTIDGQPAVILEITTMDEENHHEYGGHLYVFRATNIGDSEYYLATGSGNDTNIYVRHISTGSETNRTDFAFRNRDAFTKDGTAGTFSSFESVKHAGQFIRHTGFNVLLATKNENDKVWRGDVSWKLVDPK